MEGSGTFCVEDLDQMKIIAQAGKTRSGEFTFAADAFA